MASPTSHFFFTQTFDVLCEAHTRLDNAIQKVKPFLHVATVPLAGGEKCKVRYFFREAAQTAAPHDSTDGATSKRRLEPLLVFFHGLGCSKYDFVGGIDRLKNACILALDWSCTGIMDTSHFEQDEAFLDALEKNGRRFSLDVMAEFAHLAIRQILHDLGYEQGSRFILVGHSMGAKVATLYASEYPQDLAALVNVEGHLHPADPRMARKLVQQLEDEIQAQSKKRRLEASRSDEIEGQTADNEAKVMKEAFQRIQIQLLESAPDSDAIAKWMQAMKRMTCAKGFFAQARAIASEGEEKPDRLWRLFVGLVDQGRAQGETSNAANGASHSLKILHMYGQRNRDLLSTSLEIYRNQCTGSIDIKEISNSGHFPFFDNPDEFWMVLENWLSENCLLDTTA